MAFKNGVVPENWISAVIVPLNKIKCERIECKNYRGISLISVVGKKVTEGLNDDELGGFRSGKGCLDQIFTLKQTAEKEREKKHRVYISLID